MSPEDLFHWAVVIAAIAVGGVFVVSVIMANYIAGNDQWGDTGLACFFLEWFLLWVLAQAGD